MRIGCFRPLRASSRLLPLGLGLVCLASCGGGAAVSPPPLEGDGRSESPPPESPAGVRLPGDARPTAYRIALTVDPDAERFAGEVHIEATLAEARRFIHLHGQDLTVTRAEVVLPDGTAVPARFTQIREDGLALLEANEELPAGPVTLHFEYTAPLSRSLQGLYRVTDGGASYAFTQFEATWARMAFPSFDEPAYKAPVELTLVVPEGQVAVANTPEVERGAATEGKVRVRFAPTPPLPTYLVAFAVGPLDIVEARALPPNEVRSRSVPLRGIAARGRGRQLSAALDRVAPLLAALERYFGTPYPYAKLDIMAVPDFASGAMENVGLVTFRETLLLFDEDAPDWQQRAFAYVMAHELAHMWFGNQVTMPFWDDLWLNEAFATWMGHRAVGEVHPEYHSSLSEILSVHSAMASDSLVSARRIRQPIDTHHDIRNAFDTITYRKGGGILRMFERFVGAARFRDGIRLYLSRHHEGTATADDLMRALSTVAEQDLEGPFRSFLERTGVPVVEATLECGQAGQTGSVGQAGQASEANQPGAAQSSLVLRQTRYRPIGSLAPEESSPWQIPVCVRYGTDRAEHEACTLLTTREARLPLPDVACPTWVMPNAGGAGYYRFALAPDALEGLARVGRRFLSPEEQLAVVDSVVAQYDRGGVPTRTLWRFLAEQAESNERLLATAPIAPLSFVIERVVDGPVAARARANARRLYEPKMRALGWGARGNRAEDGERRLLRAEVIRFLALVTKDPAVRRQALDKARDFLGVGGDRRRPEAVEAGLVGTVLIVGVQDGGAELFEAAERALVSTGDALLRGQLLRALGATTDPALAERARALALDPRVRLNEAPVALYAQMENRETRDAAFGWLEANWDALVGRIGAERAGYLVGLGASFCSEAGAARVEAHFGPRAEGLGGGPRTLAATLEQVRLCASRVEAQRADAESFFGGAP